MPLNVLGELGDDDVAGSRQGTVLNDEAATADGDDQAIRRERGFPGNDF